MVTTQVKLSNLMKDRTKIEQKDWIENFLFLEVQKMEPHMPFPEKAFRIPGDNSPVAYCNFDTQANAEWFCRVINDNKFQDEQQGEKLTIAARLWPEEERHRPSSQLSQASEASSGDVDMYHTQQSYPQQSYPHPQHSYPRPQPCSQQSRSPPVSFNSPRGPVAVWGGKDNPTEFPALTQGAADTSSTKAIDPKEPPGTNILATLLVLDKQMDEARKTIVALQENMATVATLQEKMENEMVILQQQMVPLEEKYKGMLATLNKRITMQ